MNESKQISALSSLAEVARAREQPQKRGRLASIRVSPGSYLAVASVLTFASALLLRYGNDILALVALTSAWFIVPALAFADRLTFDGERLTRQGPVPLILRLISGRRQQLYVGDFETVDTSAV